MMAFFYPFFDLPEQERGLKIVLFWGILLALFLWYNGYPIELQTIKLLIFFWKNPYL